MLCRLCWSMFVGSTFIFVSCSLGFFTHFSFFFLPHCFHPCTVEDWFPGKVSPRQSVDLFAVTGEEVEDVEEEEGGRCFLGEPGNADWLMLGLPADQCCCGTTQLTADNEQHTLLIGRVSSTTPKKKRAPAIMGPVAHELGSQQGNRGSWGQEFSGQPELSSTGKRT